jgi:hypothetical protein
MKNYIKNFNTKKKQTVHKVKPQKLFPNSKSAL